MGMSNPFDRIVGGGESVVIDENGHFGYGEDVNGTAGQLKLSGSVKLLGGKDVEVFVDRNEGNGRFMLRGGWSGNKFLSSEMIATGSPPYNLRLGDDVLAGADDDLFRIDGVLNAESFRSGGAPTKPIADDSVVSISPPQDLGTLSLADLNGKVEQAVAQYNLDTASMVGVNSTSNVAFQTGSLSGTTGTDGTLTVSADAANGQVDVENRLGAEVTLSFVLLG